MISEKDIHRAQIEGALFIILQQEIKNLTKFKLTTEDLMRLGQNK